VKDKKCLQIRPRAIDGRKPPAPQPERESLGLQAYRDVGRKQEAREQQ
jgi:hypothetical protein